MSLGAHVSLDRLMAHANNADLLNRITGMLVGGMTDIRDGSVRLEMSVEEIIDYWCPKSVPLAFGVPFGHGERKVCIPIGERARLTVGSNSLDLEYPRTLSEAKYDA